MARAWAMGKGLCTLELGFLRSVEYAPKSSRARLDEERIRN